MRNQFLSLSFLRLSILFLAALAAVAQAQHSNAFTGTWKLNRAKSTYPPGMTPRSLTIRMLEDGKTFISGTSALGGSYEMSFPWSDGKDVPVEGMTGMKNVTIKQQIYGNVLDVEWKADGRTFMTAHAVISPDGKKQTGTVTRTDEEGHRTQSTEFYEKQP